MNKCISSSTSCLYLHFYSLFPLRNPLCLYTIKFWTFALSNLRSLFVKKIDLWYIKYGLLFLHSGFCGSVIDVLQIIGLLLSSHIKIQLIYLDVNFANHRPNARCKIELLKGIMESSQINKHLKLLLKGQSL